MKGMGLKFTPVIGERLLCHSSMFGPILGLMVNLNNPNGGFNLPLASHPPLPFPGSHSPPVTCH